MRMHGFVGMLLLQEHFQGCVMVITRLYQVPQSCCCCCCCRFLIQMTAPSFTTLTTVRRTDANMMKDIEELLKFTPHILIFWRPDISSYKAYMLSPAAKGAKVENATATLLPSIEGREKGAAAFKIMTRTLNDDSDAMEFLCPLQVRAAWATLVSMHTSVHASL
jgi:hypothetical protein